MSGTQPALKRVPLPPLAGEGDLVELSYQDLCRTVLGRTQSSLRPPAISRP